MRSQPTGREALETKQSLIRIRGGGWMVAKMTMETTMSWCRQM